MDESAMSASVDALPELTVRQMGFLSGILRGQSGFDAYCDNYTASGMSNPAIYVEAHRVRANPKIVQWLAISKQLSLHDVKCTLLAHLRELERLKQLAESRNNVSAAVACEHLRGKAMGLYVERYENVTPEDPIKILRELAKVNPEYALALAIEHKLDWRPGETVTLEAEKLEAPKPENQPYKSHRLGNWPGKPPEQPNEA